MGQSVVPGCHQQINAAAADVQVKVNGSGLPLSRKKQLFLTFSR